MKMQELVDRYRLIFQQAVACLGKKDRVSYKVLVQEGRKLRKTIVCINPAMEDHLDENINPAFRLFFNRLLGGNDSGPKLS